MNVVCSYCLARHWVDEKISTSSKTNPKFGMCCNHGKVALQPLREPPPVLQHLLTSNDDQSKEFRTNIRQYNMALAFTSLGVQDDKTVNRRGAWVFRILGQLSHYSGALAATEESPQYAQLYLYDPAIALTQRMHRNSNLCTETMASLQDMLSSSHRYATIYKHAFEVLSEHRDAEDVDIRLRVIQGTDRRRYNLPIADEVALILPGSGEANYDHQGRDIVLRLRNSGDKQLQRIHETHPAYVPLHYVLLFPHGDHGWHSDLRLQPEPGAESQPQRKRLTAIRYYAYRLQVRDAQFSTIHLGGRLFQQFVVDMWASAEQNRLSWYRLHQNELRASLYSGLEDTIHASDGNVGLNELGTRFVLPSSFTGSARNMQQNLQDAMAAACFFRHVDLFITITANPSWTEILRELPNFRTSYDRADLVARVFKLKLNALLKDICRNGIFGHVVAYVYTIEFQKRGLPHAHIIVILCDGYRIITPEDVDSIISTKWPDPVTQPKLFETISRCMVHGPCGSLNPNAPCMENGKCTKFFPKSFNDRTSMEDDGYPDYHRPDDGRVFRVGCHMVDNRWIVPYNPYLSAKYDCHINVECAASVRSIKYIFKYIHKGGDRATLEVDHDEIKLYVDGRYIAAPEAIWRIFQFDVHEQVPNVVRLAIHLPGQHLVIYNPNEDPALLLQHGAQEKTTLTEFFKLCASQTPAGEEARQYTYQEFPQHFTWTGSKKQWSRRKHGFAIGRMYFVPPTAGERFYLRTLLTIVKGPTSFQDLRTYNSITYDTFREACLARGLLEDDGEWQLCLQEASVMQTGSCLRSLFASILLFCSPHEPEVLWDEFRSFICDDLRWRLLRQGIDDPSDDDTYDYGLFILNEALLQSGKTLADFSSMPIPRRNWSFARENPLISEQLNYNTENERSLAETNISQLNEDQHSAFTQIMDSVKNGLGKVFFVNGPGGCGKTFLYKTIAHLVRLRVL